MHLHFNFILCLASTFYISCALRMITTTYLTLCDYCQVNTNRLTEGHLGLQMIVMHVAVSSWEKSWKDMDIAIYEHLYIFSLHHLFNNVTTNTVMLSDSHTEHRATELYITLALFLYLAWLSPWLWRWRQYIPPNVSGHLPVYTMLCSRRQYSS